MLMRIDILDPLSRQHIEFGSSADNKNRADKVKNNQQALMDEMNKVDEDGKHKHDTVTTGPSHDIVKNLVNNLAVNATSGV